MNEKRQIGNCRINSTFLCTCSQQTAIHSKDLCNNYKCLLVKTENELNKLEFTRKSIQYQVNLLVYKLLNIAKECEKFIDNKQIEFLLLLKSNKCCTNLISSLEKNSKISFDIESCNDFIND